MNKRHRAHWEGDPEEGYNTYIEEVGDDENGDNGDNGEDDDNGDGAA